MKITEKMLDNVWSKLVKDRAGNKCEVCGKTSYLNAHHIFSRSNRSTRWDVENGISLCASHHILDSKFSAHKAPADFVEWIKLKRGAKWYAGLRRRAKEVYKPDYPKIKEYLEEKLKEL